MSSRETELTKSDRIYAVIVTVGEIGCRVSTTQKLISFQVCCIMFIIQLLIHFFC